MSEAVLVVNLGTPDAPDVASVRRYLNEFLMDPHVVALPWIARRLLVSGFILPFRPKRSAQAYASIWSDDGSPLLYHSKQFTQALEAHTGLPCELGMRYGNPSLIDAINRLSDRGASRLRVLLMYPQHADSTRTTSIEAILRHLPEHMECSFADPFYNHSDYIDVLAQTIRQGLPEHYDHLLLSYHGLPEAHLKTADPSGEHCLSSPDCCERQSIAHATCYRHQARRSTALLRTALGLDAERCSMSYQSRLGRQKWIEPYTNQVLEELPSRNVKHLAVACPAFVADNLETLEEIGIQGRETFLNAGGESLTLIPCLNTDEDWVSLAASWTT